MAPPRRRAGVSTARGGRRGRGAAAHQDEDTNSERWLVTYADMLTVMLALFIVLFAISALNESKFKELKYSLAAVFGDGSIGVLDGSPDVNDAQDQDRVLQPPERPDTPDQHIESLLDAVPIGEGWQPGWNDSATKGTDLAVSDKESSGSGYIIDTGSEELNSAIRVELQSFDEIRLEIDSHLDAAGMRGAVSYAVDSRGLIVTVVTNALVFPGNSATLLPRGEKLLAAITPAIRKVPNDIEVDGFTNQVDVDTHPFPSGWELSSARASAVVRYLESHGVKDRLLAAVGYSDQKPLIDPEDPESITRNRRVEIIVLSTLPSVAGTAMADAANTPGDIGADVSKQSTEPADSPARPQGQAARGTHVGSTQEPHAAAPESDR